MWRILILIALFPTLSYGQSATSKDQSKYYIQAIAEYIKATNKRDKSILGTLYIGKHTDLPTIKLPAVIENTKIVLLTMNEADKKLRTTGKPMVYTNIIATIAKDKSEFMFIVFLASKSSGAPIYESWHDCYLDFNYDAKTKKYQLAKVRFQDH